MHTLNSTQLEIINFIKTKPRVSFSEVFENLSEKSSERTVKRNLTELVEQGFLTTEGGGRSLVYIVSLVGRFFLPIKVDSYNSQEPDKRTGVLPTYQFDVFSAWPETVFSGSELDTLKEKTDNYQTRTVLQTEDIKARELERFVIELSWKSSRIEGNTYTLLDTERLIKEGVPSASNTEAETTMILNHKKAFDFVREQVSFLQKGLTIGFIEQVHLLLMQGLLVDTGMRKSAVGITGSFYRPLDNQFQINEALQTCVENVNSTSLVFDKALSALIGISYIQPFVDGNKRTARLVANGLLLAGGAAPLSYRNVDETTYRGSLLAFYEQLSILPMKELFIEQYIFATEQY
jgi:Fic family protein